MRDAFVAMGVLAETFETAITWERFPAFHEQRERRGAGGGAPRVRRGRAVFCRFTHVYPDGPAPYFTVIAPARRGEEVEQWAAIKRAASDAVHRGRGHDHPSPRGRARPPAVV